MKRRPPDALDTADKAIVELLQEDGRMSYTRIAAAVGLSEAAVRSRVQRLIEGNVVQIVGVTDPLRLGFRRQAMVGVKTEGDIEAVAETLAGIPEVDYVVFVSGSYDLIFEIVCEDDEHLLSILNDKIRSIPGVRTTDTYTYLRLHKQTYAWVRVNPMLTVGIPREIKIEEHRVAMTPDGVAEMKHRSVDVVIEHDAGADSGISDDDYRAAGAQIVTDAADVWSRAGLVMKVKEPQRQEFAYLRPDLLLFTYLHLAAYPDVARVLLDAKTTSIAYETVQLPGGQLPLLAPMSEVAGRMAPQIGAHFLERAHGGRGVLLGGAPGVRPARVVVLGAGNVGWNAAWIAQGMEAEVLLLDKNLDRLRWVDQIHKGRIMTLASNRGAVSRAVADADLVIGAVLVPGGRAPVLVTDDMISTMKPAAVIVDCAIDQGGCIENIEETTHSDPVYEVRGVLHYAVGNVPGAVPNTSTYALTNATLPYAIELATRGLKGAVEADPALALGVNTCRGSVVNAAVAEALGIASVPLSDCSR